MYFQTSEFNSLFVTFFLHEKENCLLFLLMEHSRLVLQYNTQETGIPFSLLYVNIRFFYKSNSTFPKH